MALKLRTGYETSDTFIITSNLVALLGSSLECPEENRPVMFSMTHRQHFDKLLLAALWTYVEAVAKAVIQD